MTTKLLQAMGFVQGRTPRHIYHPDTEIEIRCNSLKHATADWLVSEFGRQMFMYGERTGAEKKVAEIKKALNIDV